MRQTLSISLPKKIAKKLKQDVKKGGYASVSEFIRAMYREWHEMQLAKELHEQSRLIREGHGIVLESVDDLDNL